VLLAACLSLLAAAAEAGAPVRGEGAEYVFRGNSAKSAADLRQAAAEDLADFERSGRHSDIDDAAYQMEQAYRRDGYAFARVEYELAREGDRTIVAFTVAEGPLVRVGEIRISGNAAIERETLAAFFRPESPGLLPPTERAFVPSELDAAVAAIRDYYRGRGYLDAAVEGPRYIFASDRQWVDVAVRVREGALYRVARMDVRGEVPADAAAALDDLRRSVVGQIYTSRTKWTVQAKAAEILGDRGYPDAAVAVAARFDAAPGEAALVADIEPGPAVTIAGIAIRGNERTRTEFILRRLALRPGDRYSRALEKQNFQELYKAGVFSKVEIGLEKTDAADQRILTVTVAEMPTQEIFFEPGYGSYEQLRLVAGYRLKNLFGTARSWTSEALGAVKAQAFSSTLTDPWFLGGDIRADLTALVRRREEPSFTRRDIGGTFFLNKEVSERLTVASGLTYRRTDVSDLGTAVEEEGLQDDYNFASVKLQATYDTRNDIFFLRRRRARGRPPGRRRHLHPPDRRRSPVFRSDALHRAGDAVQHRPHRSGPGGIHRAAGRTVLQRRREHRAQLQGIQTRPARQLRQAGRRPGLQRGQRRAAAAVVGRLHRQPLRGRRQRGAQPHPRGRRPAAVPQPITDPLRHAERLLPGLSTGDRLRPAVPPAGRPGAAGSRRQPGSESRPG
jgi:outer membrane protein assembly complex protein YaeT